MLPQKAFSRPSDDLLVEVLLNQGFQRLPFFRDKIRAPHLANFVNPRSAFLQRPVGEVDSLFEREKGSLHLLERGKSIVPVKDVPVGTSGIQPEKPCLAEVEGEFLGQGKLKRAKAGTKIPARGAVPYHSEKILPVERSKGICRLKREHVSIDEAKCPRPPWPHHIVERPVDGGSVRAAWQATPGICG